MTDTHWQTGPAMSAWMTVRPEWIDFNGHMNMAYYNTLFDDGIIDIYRFIGFGPDYARSEGKTTYVADFRIRYLRELHAGDRVRCAFFLLDHDSKRLHSFQQMYHEDGRLIATAEGLLLHVDLAGPNVAPIPAHIAERIDAMQAAHDLLPRPEGMGLPIGIQRHN
ncbi:MAG: thioesterase family protein [Rhodobacterales bacterium]|nr:thioesterase family protein [Rhodobacterales bacterium]